MLALEHKLHGVFNIAGPSAVPLSAAIGAIGRTSIPTPEILLHPLIEQLFRFGVYQFPASALDFLKYPCTVCDDKFRDATGFKPLFSLEDIFASVSR